jgi:flagellar basal body-associated protein FliL
MSDDTPTQRFPEQDDTQQDLQEEKQKSRGLMIGLIIAGALLLIAIVIMLILLLGPKGAETPQAGDTQSPEPGLSDTPTPVATESEAPAPTPEATQEPQPTPQPTQQPQQPQQPSGPTVTQFTTSNKTVYCNTQSPNPSHQYISFTWKTDGASQIFFGVDTNDASTASLFDNLPPMGTSQNDFPPGYTDFEFGCPDASHKYTLTVIDGSGHKASKSVKITNKGDLQ